jgi:two-component system, chemotaxis family, chemotaxis protein CheY
MKPTLLIVDDIASIRDKLRDCLENEFEIVGLASSGAQAVQLCQQTRPQLVLMDLVMPLMSGIDATRAIVAAVTPAPRIVVLSALHDENIVIRALEAGAAEFLVKPVSEVKIRAALKLLASEAA